jgi:adenylate kinase family enzyme
LTRIMIIGSGGSGKSTFAAELGKLAQLPVYHLDAYYWRPGWVATPNEEWDQFLKQLVLEDEWIIDGNYGRTLEIRMNKSDVIIFFDLPPWITTYRVIKRRIKYHGKTRPDLNEGCPEQLDWDFIKWVWNFRRTRRPGILEKLRIHGEDKKIIIFKNTTEVRELLRAVKDNGVGYFREGEYIT